jgi:hypothetical protein
MNTTVGLSIAALGFLAAAPAQAKDEAPAAGESSGGWEFSITPYLWGAGEKGDIQAFAVAPPVDVDLKFSDIFDHLDFAAMGTVQAKNGRFVSMADIAYVKVSASKGVGVRDPDFIDIDLETSTFTATALAGYRAVDQGEMFLDLMGGGRLNTVKTKLSLSGPVRSLSGKSSETWLDPVIAARFHAPIGGDWAFVIYGDVGGFGLGSDLTWQLQGAVQYHLSRHWSLEAGWRQFAVDYDKQGFLYDVKLGGPLLGATYRF